MDRLSSFTLLTGAVRASIAGRGAPATGSDAGRFREGITDPIAGVIRDRPGPTGTVAVPAGIADRTVRVIRSVAGRSRADIGALMGPITDQDRSGGTRRPSPPSVHRGQCRPTSPIAPRRVLRCRASGTSASGGAIPRSASTARFARACVSAIWPEYGRPGRTITALESRFGVAFRLGAGFDRHRCDCRLHPMNVGTARSSA